MKLESVIRKNNLENTILKEMENINDAVKNINSAIFNYEAITGEDINFFKPFSTNYPFIASIEEVEKWGEE